MSDSTLVDTAIAIATALEVSRAASYFVTDVFDVDWDFENRTADKGLSDSDLHVRVIVPRNYVEISRLDRGSLQYWAAFDVDVRQKLTTSNQGADQAITKARLQVLSQLTEEIHKWFYVLEHLTTPNSRDALWWEAPSEVSDQSRILVAYSTKYLRETRQWYSCCRELFQITD